MARKIYKDKILSLRLNEPDLSYQEIADRIGCKINAVYSACHTADLKIGRPKVFRDVIKLGWAAQRAGLTLQQIESMANARNA
jgi:hypothetical protein